MRCSPVHPLSVSSHPILPGMHLTGSGRSANQPSTIYYVPKTLNEGEERLSQGLNPMPHHQIALMEKRGKLKHRPRVAGVSVMG